MERFGGPNDQLQRNLELSKEDQSRTLTVKNMKSSTFSTQVEIKS